MKIKRKAIINIKKTSLFVLFTFSSSTAFSAISAVTAKTIQGNSPYFQLNDTPIDSSLDLLGFSYKDASGVTQYTTIEPALTGTDVIVSDTMKVTELKALTPITGVSTSIDSILGSELVVTDEDGDSVKHATGNLIATLYKDGTKQDTLPDAVFDKCASYALTIGIDTSVNATGNISALTDYGDPRVKNYVYPDSKFGSGSISSVTYNIKPQSAGGNCSVDYTVYAQPNLTPSNTKAGTSWVANSGFSISNDYNNFPTTGFQDAQFILTFKGDVTADDVIANTPSPVTVSGSNITLTLSKPSSSDNSKLQVTLNGPYSPATLSGSQQFTPADAVTELPVTFKLKTATATVYQFTIKKWLVFPYQRGASGGGSYSVPKTRAQGVALCNNLAGSNTGKYRLPDLSELTNSSYVNNDDVSILDSKQTGGSWNGTESGNKLDREVGGGFISEWGALSYYSIKSQASAIMARQDSPTYLYTAVSATGAVRVSSASSGTGIPACISNN